MNTVLNCELLFDSIIEIFEVHLLIVYQVADLDFHHLQEDFILALSSATIVIRSISQGSITCLGIQLPTIVKQN